MHKLTTVALLVSAFALSGCAGVKEAWLGVDADLHKQLFSQRDKHQDSPKSHWFGTLKRDELDDDHINAWWSDAYKLDTLSADRMCIKLLNHDDEKASQENAAAEHIAQAGRSGWAAGSAVTLEAEYPAGTPWPKRTADDQVTIKTASQVVKEGDWNTDHTRKWSGSLVTWTQVCVPAPKVTPETKYLTMARLNAEKDGLNMILVWEIVD